MGYLLQIVYFQLLLPLLKDILGGGVHFHEGYQLIHCLIFDLEEFLVDQLLHFRAEFFEGQFLGPLRFDEVVVLLVEIVLDLLGFLPSIVLLLYLGDIF